MDQDTAERIATSLEKIADKMEYLYDAWFPIDTMCKNLEGIEDKLRAIDESLMDK